MSLLIDTMTNSLDPAYAEVARRRASRPGSAPPRRSVYVALSAAAAGLLLGIAALQTHNRAPARAAATARLLDTVKARTSLTEQLQERLDQLRGKVAAERASVLSATSAGSALGKQLQGLEAAAGTVPLTGDGLRVHLDDAPAPGTQDNNPLGGPDPRTAEGPTTSRILDRDIQQVVNALWAAGARGIAVNGQRVTAQTAIRSAGAAILVDYRPLSPPYDVTAVGDPATLESAFGNSPTADRFRAYEDLYGLRFDYARVRRVTLPAAPGLSLRFAEPAARSTP